MSHTVSSACPFLCPETSSCKQMRCTVCVCLSFSLVTLMYYKHKNYNNIFFSFSATLQPQSSLSIAQLAHHWLLFPLMVNMEFLPFFPSNTHAYCDFSHHLFGFVDDFDKNPSSSSFSLFLSVLSISFLNPLTHSLTKRHVHFQRTGHHLIRLHIFDESL